jgi:hypothetical protein
MGYMMNQANQALASLVKKYYGYVADLEGSGVELFDLLFVRDKIQIILNQSTPAEAIPASLYEQIYQLDWWLWQEKRSFLAVIGLPELRHARQQQQSPRSHWWWYLDEFSHQPQVAPVPAIWEGERLVVP